MERKISQRVLTLRSCYVKFETGAPVTRLAGTPAETDSHVGLGQRDVHVKMMCLGQRCGSPRPIDGLDVTLVEREHGDERCNRVPGTTQYPAGAGQKGLCLGSGCLALL